MMQRGRKSASALSVVSIETVPRLRVPDGLSNAEANLFRDIVAKCAADHFVPSDAPMLVAYCQAVLLTRGAFKMLDDSGMGFQQWQSAAKTMATLATKLRLCPHSRSDPKTITRHSRELGIGPRPWEFPE